MLKETSLFMGITALLFASGCGSYPSAPAQKETGENLLRNSMRFATGYKTREDVKALFPSADSWLETEYGRANFMFCAIILPSWGSSRIDIHAWIFRRHTNQWEEFLSIRTNAVGDVVLSVDSKTGRFSAKGSANNKFANQEVCTFDLNATGE